MSVWAVFRELVYFVFAVVILTAVALMWLSSGKDEKKDPVVDGVVQDGIVDDDPISAFIDSWRHIYD